MIDKKLRRQERKAVLKEAYKHAVKRNGMFATNAQLTAAAKLLRDRFFTAKTNAPLPLSK